MPINRRKVLGGASLAGAAAATGARVDRLISEGTPGYRTGKEEPMTDDAARFGNPRLPAETITSQSHLFPLGAQPPNTYDGSSFQQASEDNFPILKGQEANSELRGAAFPSFRYSSDLCCFKPAHYWRPC
jgi:oxalate decarboxylase